MDDIAESLLRASLGFTALLTLVRLTGNKQLGQLLGNQLIRKANDNNVFLISKK